MCRRGQIRQNRSILYGDLRLVIIAIRDPCLHGGVVERAGDEPLVEGMPIVVAIPADRAKPRDEAGFVRYNLRLKLRTAYRGR
jgi:hypothetical protein